MKRCEVCGDIDEYYDEGAFDHKSTVKHRSNQILLEYKHKKKQAGRFGEGVSVMCTAEIFNGNNPVEAQNNSEMFNIRVSMKPNQCVRFSFSIHNKMTDEDVKIIGVHLAHPQPQFQINQHPFDFDAQPNILKSKHSKENAVTVSFTTKEIGQYDMPIMFTFHRDTIEKDFIYIREMTVMVQNEPGVHQYLKTPFNDKVPWDKNDNTKTLPPVGYLIPHYIFNVPVNLKKLFAWNLNEAQIEKSNGSEQFKAILHQDLTKVKFILRQGLVEDNYINFFHHLLYWEETKARISIRKYNMIGVTILKDKRGYWLQVPGLAEKRPSLLRGDLVCIRQQVNIDLLFQAEVKDMKDDKVLLASFNQCFNKYYNPEALFDVRFLMSRVPMERMHDAVSKVFTSGHRYRIFPELTPYEIPVNRIKKFHNKFIKGNPEQRSAVEHIVAGSSGLSPYIVFGPPGTGKTMTIVEAIIQIVVRDPLSRVLVCTDSNMAADHIAVMLMKYNEKLNINKYLLRASSRNREWNILPPELHNVSNGKSFKDFFSVTNDFARSHRILVTTHLHAAKFGIRKDKKVEITHLFLDEAAQAMEPAALVPITNLLVSKGQLVLAGDPMQLGPVCLSHQAKDTGLGISLLERLWKTYTNLYGDHNPNYATILVNNFRSHPDILKLPNELFYSTKPLQPKAELDCLSETSILGDGNGTRAIVFHSVNSKEQRTGKAPSYFNDMELKMLQTYVKALAVDHKVSPKDIGIIAPYIRQVYKIKEWLKDHEYSDVEVGSVEAFQGKEKRVILLSTVRANCKLLDYDAKYNLGFVGERKRFNVALTRAKAKIVIIGNPACLIRCECWRRFMDVSEELNSYLGKESEQIERTKEILDEVSRIRFNRCRLTQVLRQAMPDNNNNQRTKKVLPILRI